MKTVELEGSDNVGCETTHLSDFIAVKVPTDFDETVEFAKLDLESNVTLHCECVDGLEVTLHKGDAAGGNNTIHKEIDIPIKRDASQLLSPQLWQLLDVRFEGTTPLAQPWLRVPTSQGDVGEPLRVELDPAGLAEAALVEAYSATVEIEAYGADGVARNVSVPVHAAVTANVSGAASVWGRASDGACAPLSCSGGARSLNESTGFACEDGRAMAIVQLGKPTRLPFTTCDVDALPVNHRLPLPPVGGQEGDPRALTVHVTPPVVDNIPAPETTLVYAGAGRYEVVLDVRHGLGEYSVALELDGEPLVPLPVLARCPTGLVPLPGNRDCGCDAGQEPAGTGAAPPCRACPAGHSSLPGATECHACAAGTYAQLGMLCTDCPAGRFGALEAQADCETCERGTHAAGGAVACVPCGLRDPYQRTAESAGEFGAASPAGINCSMGVLHGTLPGHWASTILGEKPTNETRAWECEPREACLGGLNSTCSEGHQGVLCSGCKESHYLTSGRLCVPFSGEPPGEDALVGFALLQLGFFVLLGQCFVCCCWCFVQHEEHKIEKKKHMPPWEEKSGCAEEELSAKSIRLRRWENRSSSWRPSNPTGNSQSKRRTRNNRGASSADGGDDATTQPVRRRTTREIFRALRLKGRLVGRLLVVGRAAAARYHVWVHREADDFLVPFSFGAYVAETLRSFGVDARAETDAEADLQHATVCIFLLSDSVFGCDRSLSLMRQAVQLGKQCVIINMPGAKYGPERDKPFPENSFNPGWEPFCPELKPAFAEIAVTWELEYPHACVQELLKRTASHLKRLLGRKVCDVVEATKKLNAEEEAALRASMNMQPEGVVLEWDWTAKVFDAFLSHKITDAKDIVLTWYNTLSALGYHPFVDRLNLDAVENIPTYVEQTASFVIALTSNLFVSYWCAVELCKACDLHEEGLINILLVPVQGETWDHEGTTFDFPPPAKVMENFGKWFPELADETRARVARLYGGGEYTESRLVKHTLMHYKSFERLLVARIGLSIRKHIVMAERLAAGGATAAMTMAAIETLVHEANAYGDLLGAHTHFEMVEEFKTSASGHKDLHDVTVSVAEKLGEVQLRLISAEDFAMMVATLRQNVKVFGKAEASYGLAIEQWMNLQSSELNPCDADLVKDLREKLSPLSEALKIVVSYFQIAASVVFNLPGVHWPEAFLWVVDRASALLFDFVELLRGEPFSALVGDRLHAASSTLIFACGVLVLFGSVPLGFRLFVALRRPPHGARAEFFDRCIELEVALAFLLYPVLCIRLLKLFHAADYDEERVLASDPRLRMDDIGEWQQAAGLFVALYIVGIPLAFFTCLWCEVRPNFGKGHVDVTSAEGVMRVAREARLLTRFGLLFSKYRRECWWFEMVEMPRKLLLVGSIIFVASGTTMQIYYAVFVALASVLVLTGFKPYADQKMSAVAWVCQLCTLLTFVCALALRNGGHEFDPDTEAGFEATVSSALLVLQTLPLLAVSLLICSSLNDVRRLRRKRDPKRRGLPGALRDDDPTAPPGGLRGLLFKLTGGKFGGHTGVVSIGHSAHKMGGTLSRSEIAAALKRHDAALAEASHKAVQHMNHEAMHHQGHGRHSRWTSAKTATRWTAGRHSERHSHSESAEADGPPSDIPPHLALRSRVTHDSCGPGIVARHQMAPPTKIFVAFDSGETHGYRASAWPKIRPEGSRVEVGPAKVPKRLGEGARVQHPKHGQGTVSTFGKGHWAKVVVKFDNGETHGYKAPSWIKLQSIVDDPPSAAPQSAFGAVACAAMARGAATAGGAAMSGGTRRASEAARAAAGCSCRSWDSPSALALPGAAAPVAAPVAASVAAPVAAPPPAPPPAAPASAAAAAPPSTSAKWLGGWIGMPDPRPTPKPESPKLAPAPSAPSGALGAKTDSAAMGATSAEERASTAARGRWQSAGQQTRAVATLAKGFSPSKYAAAPLGLPPTDDDSQVPQAGGSWGRPAIRKIPEGRGSSFERRPRVGASSNSARGSASPSRARVDGEDSERESTV